MPPAALAVDRWQGEERVQLRLIDVAPADRRYVRALAEFDRPAA